MAALTLGAAPAHAEVLVSNLDQAAAPLELVDYGKREYAEGRITTSSDRVYVPYASQRFRTGPNAGGYTLEEFRIDILDLSYSGAKMTVALFTDDAGKPGSLVAVLYPQGGFRTGTMRFRTRRQSGAYPHLAPNTYYHVEFQERAGRVYWSITDSDLESGADGWSLDDEGLSFINASSHTEVHSGVGLLHQVAQGEYGDPSETSPGFDLVLGWTGFPRAFRSEIRGSIVTGSVPELAATYSRTVAENAAPGTAVGEPVTASDSDGDEISYELAGRDAGAFAIDADSGQIRTRQGVFYDYEIKDTYTVTVIADDGNGNMDTAVVTITLTNVVAEVLTASFEGAPAEHRGAPFVMRLVFSEPTSVGWTTVRDSLLSVTNAKLARARRLDLDRGLKELVGSHLSARWELTIEPTGGDVTVVLPATTDCAAADAVCTRDRRTLSAGVTVTVAAGTVPALTASFAGAPAQHDGSQAFTLQLNFNAAVTTSLWNMRTHALRVTNGRVTNATRQTGQRARWLLTVEPSSLHDVTVELAAPASCGDAGAVCAADGRMLSRGADVSVTGPASIPLTGEGDFYLPMHDREPFNIGLTFSWAVKITPEAMRAHAFRITNGEIIAANRVRDDSGRWWHIRVLPWSNKTITIDLPVTTDCGAAGAVCTRDGRMLSDAYNWLFTPMDPDAVDDTDPALTRAEVDGATLTLLYSEGLDESSTPAADAFAVTVAGTARSLAASDPVTVRGRRVILALASAAAHGETVALSYTPPSDNRLRDVAGNDAEAVSGQAVSNRTAELDTAAPTLQAAAANGDYVMLIYDEALDESSTPAADAFSVTVAGAARDLAASNPVAVSGRTVTLTLASPLTDGEAVTVSYTVPSSNPLQDTAGNDAAALSGQEASTRSPVSTSTIATDALTAVFRGLPESHGRELFTFELKFFGEQFEVSYRTLRGKAFSVMNGRVTKAVRWTQGNNMRWRITVDPDGAGNVVVTLPARQDCAAEGAICTDDDRPLAESVMAVIPEHPRPPPVAAEDPPEQPEDDPNAPLTVKFEEGSLPATHNGHDPIVFRIAFSHEPKSGYDYMTLRNETLSMTLGNLPITPRRAFRLDRPSGKRWEIVVSQMRGSPVFRDVADEDLTVTIRPTRDCDDAGAVCTEDGRKLSNRISATITGRPVPSLSVVDSEVSEGAAATVDLAVTLSGESASEAVTVDYATSDGTATAGEDYTATSGTLTFEVGELAKTVQVEVLDDSVSERREQFRLDLSNASGADARIGDARGFGTIMDDDRTSVTASFASMPTSHDGSKAFTFRLDFDEEFPISWSNLQESALQVSNGQVTAVGRIFPPKNQHWNITVRPASREAVAITLTRKETCEETGAICTTDGRGLAAPVSATVPGPPALSVADARVQEAAGATVDFVVNLNPAAAAPVTVEYATGDDSATAGQDYTAASGTLTFAVGETAKTVSVAVLDDALNEGEEHFTLTLSNPSGGDAWLADATATGTIVNSDPLPRAWLARFGRTAAGHVLEAVQARLSGGQGSQATLAGQRLQGLDAAAAAAAQEAYERAWEQRQQEGHLAGLPRSLEFRELWAGSSFALAAAELPGAAGADGGGRWSAWGRGAWSGFTGTEAEVSVDGDVVTGVVGADYERDALLAGLAVAYSSGSGGYRDAASGDAGELAAWLVGVHPYVRLTLHERLTVWGLFGYGMLGELEVKPERAAAVATELGLVLGAFGARGTLLAAAASGGLELAARADGLLLRANTEAARGLAATEAEVTRTRLLLEGSYALAVLGGELRPELEAGVRHDGGDAERGAGLVLGGSASYRQPAWGLSVEASGQGLLRPESWQFSEWGAAGALRLDPGEPGLGVAVSAAPAWGAAASGGGERLWQVPDASALTAGGAAAAGGRLEAEVSYGLEVAGGSGLLTPYASAGMTEAGGRTWRAGTRVTVASGLNLGVEGTRSEPPAGAAAEHTFTVNGELRW